MLRKSAPFTRALFACLALLSSSAHAQREAVDREPRERPTTAQTARPPAPAPAPVPAPTVFADRFPNQPSPVGYHRELRRNPSEAAIGAVLFVLTYGTSYYIGASAASCKPGRDGDECSFAKTLEHGTVPFVGPILFAAEFCSDSVYCNAIAITDSALQLLGAYMIVDGLLPKSYLVADKPAASRPKLSVSASPVVGGSLFAIRGVF